MKLDLVDLMIDSIVELGHKLFLFGRTVYPEPKGWAPPILL